MGREKRVSVLNPDREGAGGTGWADRLYPPHPRHIGTSKQCLPDSLSGISWHKWCAKEQEDPENIVYQFKEICISF